MNLLNSSVKTISSLLAHLTLSSEVLPSLWVGITQFAGRDYSKLVPRL